MKSIVVKMLLLIALLYGSITYMLYSTQEKKIFLSNNLKECTLTKAKEIKFKTSDGFILDGAYLENRKNLPLVLYFGGNAENSKCFINNISSKLKGYNFISFNYPGYLKSEGKSSEKTILKYALEIYNKYKAPIVMGRSLGTAIATYVASKENIKSLILITPLDSILNIAKSKFPYLPVSYILKHKFQADIWMQNVQANVAVILVENENIIPKKSIENILSKIKNLKYKDTIKGANHSNLYNYPQTIKVLQKALDTLELKK